METSATRNVGSSQKLRKLEAVRGFAAAYVVMHHTVPHSILIGGVNLGNAFRFGQEAVILFFLVSGFVIAYSYAQSSDQSFRGFFLRRFSRIYFPLFVVMFLGWSMECYRVAQLANVRPKELLLNLLMLQDVSALKPNTIVDPYMHNTPLWSLSYEWWFYMLFFPLTLFVQRIRAGDLVVFVGTVAATIAYALSPNFVSRELAYLSIWWTGVYLARKKVANGTIVPADALLPGCTLFVICSILTIPVVVSGSANGAVHFGVHPLLELRHFAFALLITVLAVVWQRHNWVLFEKTLGPFAVLAPISYVIYIGHQYLMVEATYLAGLGNPIVEWLGYAAVLLLFAFVIEVLAFPRIQKAWLRATMPLRDAITEGKRA